jgi:hypothetical protein
MASGRIPVGQHCSGNAFNLLPFEKASKLVPAKPGTILKHFRNNFGANSYSSIG